MKKGKKSKKLWYGLIIILVLIGCISFITNNTYERILPCAYTSNRGLPASRITQLPERFDIDIRSSDAITLYALNALGERVCFYSNENTVVSLSPDGQSIAFEAYITYPSTIIITSSTGETVIDPTQTLTYPARFPVWSSNSEHLAFSYGDIGSEVYIYSIRDSRLINFPLRGGTAVYSEDWASWSPDDNFLVIAVQGGPGNSGSAGIYLVDLGESELIQLTTSQTDTIHGRPNWSANGEQITFLAGSLYNRETRTYEFEEDCVVDVTTRYIDC